METSWTNPIGMAEPPRMAGWYAVRIPRPDRTQQRRTLFVFPGERSMLGEIHEVPPIVVDLSRPPYDLAEFAGPFATREEAEAAHDTGRRTRRR